MADYELMIASPTATAAAGAAALPVGRVTAVTMAVTVTVPGAPALPNCNVAAGPNSNVAAGRGPDRRGEPESDSGPAGPH